MITNPINSSIQKISGKVFLALLLTFLLSACTTVSHTIHPVEMVEIPSGPFKMGAVIENPQEWGDTDEEPVHEVYLDAFYIDKYEVTARDFSEFLNESLEEAPRYLETGDAVTITQIHWAYLPLPGLENYPANRVSWYGADSYCKSQGKRLPTEAEWEKAARGTDERTFPWGNKHPDNNLTTYRRSFSKMQFRVMEPVNGMPEGVSPYGVHQMAGNVWEWVNDWYEDTYYDHSPRENPQGPDSGISRVLRGGNWYYKAYYMRTTYRFNERPEVFKVWQGFRCARSKEQ